MDGKYHDINSRLLRIFFTLNGKTLEIEVKPWETTLEVLREQLGLKGTKEGCGIGECGACTILVDGLAVDSCLMPAPKLDGRNVETVEGLRQGEALHPLQEAFLSKGPAPSSRSFFVKGSRSVRVLHARHADVRKSSFGQEPKPGT